jgi:hypothetical protein
MGTLATMESVQVPVRAAILKGDLRLPASAQGLVIFAHGSGSSRFSRRNRQVAEFLGQRGLATLLLDLLTPEEEAVDLNREAMRQMHAHVELEIVAGATHLFEEPGTLEQVAELAGGWFARYLRGETVGPRTMEN